MCSLSIDLFGQTVATAGDDKLEKTPFGGCPGERGRAPNEGKTVGVEEDLNTWVCEDGVQENRV